MLSLVSTALALSPWASNQWTHDGENIIVKGLTASSSPKGPKLQGWFSSQEKGVGSWTNVVIGDRHGGNDHYGIMFSEKEMTGTQMPGVKDRVAVFFNRASEDQDLERGSSKAMGPITLVPIKPTGALAKLSRRGALDAEKRSSKKSKSMPISDLEARLSALEAKHTKEEGHEEEASLLQLEMGLQPMIDPVTFAAAYAPVAAAFAMPWVAYGAFATFVAPAFAAGTAAMLAATQSLEREHEFAFPSLEMEVEGKASPVSFRNFAELEKFLPLAPLPLYFYPWGLALGTAYFTATLAAGTELATTAATAMTSLYAPFFPFAAANAAASAKAVAAPPAAEGKGDALKSWYWGSLWWLHCAAYYVLFWQLSAYMWWYWYSLGAPQYKEYYAKVAEFWKDYYAKVGEYWKGVYAGYTDTAKTVYDGYVGAAKGYAETVKGVYTGYADAAQGAMNATATAAAAYPLAPVWPFWPVPAAKAKAAAGATAAVAADAKTATLVEKQPAAPLAAAGVPKPPVAAAWHNPWAAAASAWKNATVAAVAAAPVAAPAVIELERQPPAAATLAPSARPSAAAKA